VARRQQLQQSGAIKPLPASSQAAADKSYIDTAQKLCDGLEAVLKSYQSSDDLNRKRILRLWQESGVGG
jgi:hypothetical protein